MLTITSDDLGNIGQALRQLSGSLKNTRPLMRGIATLLENSTRKRFETKTAPCHSQFGASGDKCGVRAASSIWHKTHGGASDVWAVGAR